jgi:hypothetical protein
MRHRPPSLLSIKYTDDDKTLTVEDNQTDPVNSFFAQTTTSLAKIGEVIFRFIRINQVTEPQITHIQGKEGETFLKIYQPNTGKTFYCMTECEMMEWLDKHTR